MESIDILTGQYVTIRMEPASIVTRMAALILDYIFMFLYLSALVYLYTEVWTGFYYLSDWLEITLVITTLFPVMCYHFLFESILGGRTPGKMVAGIKVTTVDGSTPGLLSYFLRWILLPVDLFPSGGIGALTILLSSNHQRVGDMAAGTTVVKTRVNLKLDLDELYFEFPDNYQPSFREAANLSERQAAFISDLLLNPSRKSTTIDSIRNLAQKVKSVLKIKSDLEDRTFLETIVRDYNYYASTDV